MAAPTLTHGPTTREGAPAPAPSPTPAVPDRRTLRRRGDVVALAVVAVLVAACLPLLRVFVGADILRPVLAAVLLSVGLSWAARRSGAGPVTGLLVSLVGFVLLVSVAFLPHTLVLGFVPTPATLDAARQLWLEGMELVRSRPAPVVPLDGLVLLTVTGIWWVAHVVDGLVFRLDAPLRAIGMALLLWVVPLAVAPEGGSAWAWAVPLLAAATLLLAVTADAEVLRWGAPVGAPDGSVKPVGAAGWPIALVAVIAGVVLGGMLPGYEDPPWYELRGRGGTTLTTNPIVSIRSNLVALSEAPIAQVRSPRPVYLRLTALDTYGENEEWSSEGIRAGDASGRLAFETAMTYFGQIDVEIFPQGLGNAVIVPVPYHPTGLGGAPADRFRYDPASATVTVSEAGLPEGGPYTVTAAVPAPPPDLLRNATATPTPKLVALPSTVPSAVVELAEQIVTEAGATTPFERALAIQDELRTWEYSTDPPPGHGATAMESFLQQRIGYCEQYAGTMAVMLRSLGIPARVAVGYTPGEPIDEEQGLYQVRNANAHAWVEVRFDDLGWIAFEPTPRTDGNVLVPDEEDLAPALTEAQEREAAAEAQPTPTASPSPVQDFPDIETFPTERAPREAASGAEDDSPFGLLVAGLLLVLALGSGAVLLGARRRGVVTEVPAEVVLDALAAVERVAAGLSHQRRPSDTDAEYLERVFGDDQHAVLLAEAAARARWARRVPSRDAVEATNASSALRAQLLENLTQRERLRLRAGAVARRTGRWVTTRAQGPLARLRRLLPRGLRRR